MSATLELHFAVSTATVNHEDHFLETAEIIHVDVHQLYLPALRIGKTGVHPVQIGSEQCRFISAGRTANFDDNVLIIIRILRQEQNTDGLLQHNLPSGQLIDFHLDHFTHLIIHLLALHGLRSLEFFHNVLIFNISLISRLQIRLFLGIISKLLRVIRYIRIT